MFTDQTILIINVTCIVFLAVMMVVLVAATCMKGGAGWVAIAMVTTTIPAYLANTTRTLGSAEVFVIALYVAITLNVICFPALWFFVRSQLDKSFRFRWRDTLHLLPIIISLGAALIFYLPLSPEQVVAEVEYMEAGNENLPAIINDILVFGQFFAYFAAMFIFIHRRKKFFQDNYSDSDYLNIRWIPNFISVFFVFFFVAFVAYVVSPRTDAWLLPIMNAIAMGYLVYGVIFRSTQAYINRLPDIPQESSRPKEPPMSAGEMKEVCDKVIDYLKSSQAYLQQDLSLAMLVKETGIPQKMLSRSINGYLKRNFFDLVNEMRVEEAKRRLLELKTDGYKIDSIYEECGFRTRSTFFIAFKKVEGETPAHWLKMNNT